MNVNLLIQSGNHALIPVVEDGIQWQTERQGVPGTLTFTVLKDSKLNFVEGDAVRLQVGNKGVFFGFVFKKKPTKDGLIEVTAYDQLRYLKNKDTYVYTNKRADEFIRMICKDFGMSAGTLENTGYNIPTRVEDNVSLFDMILNSLDLTLQNNGRQYVLYDDFGKLALKRIQSLAVDYLIDASTAEDFDYESSIDSDTYNRVKLIRENEEKGVREVFISQDSKNINSWGVLQHFDKLQENENGKAKADALLKLYNTKTRKLSVQNALGDLRVRGGSMIVVQLDLGDVKVSNMMLVEKCTHHFSKDEHFMDLTLRGGEFVA